jgi:hypothetical protein
MTTKERSMHRGSRTPLALALLVLIAFGCGGDSDDPLSPPPPQNTGLPDSIPPANTPANLLERYEASWEHEVVAEYTAMLTADYRFTFSNQSDPVLVVEYQNTWGRSHEIASTTHLMAGFTNDQGEVQAAASSILFSLDGESIIDDPDHADSSAWYKLVTIPSFQTTIRLADSEQTEFQIFAPQRLHLVRGDAAVLAPGQVGSTDRWYLRRWVDLTPAINGPVILPATSATWGRVKAQYHR